MYTSFILFSCDEPAAFAFYFIFHIILNFLKIITFFEEHLHDKLTRGDCKDNFFPYFKSVCRSC